MMLGQDERETDTKNRTSTNSDSIQAFESFNSDI